MLSFLSQYRMSLSDRLKHSEDTGIVKQSGESRGNLEMTFSFKKVGHFRANLIRFVKNHIRISA